MFSPLNDPQVEQWFQRLNAPLKRLPAADRVELHEEVRQHLDALVAANIELGSSPQEAWGHALTQFGNPTRIGRRLAWEWRRGQGWVSADMAGVLYTLGAHLVSAATLISCTFLVLTAFPLYDPGTYFGLEWLIAVPIITGTAVGRKFPKRALAGAFYGALVWPLLPLATLFPGFTTDPPKIVLAEIAIFAAWWLSLTCVAAYLASVTNRGVAGIGLRLSDFKLTLPCVSGHK